MAPANTVWPPDLRVALVHDWLTGMRGGEKCLEVFCELFPRADIYTLLYVPGSVSKTIARHRIRTSFLQHLPAASRTYRWALPLFPRAIESFDFRAYDLVLSSSHSVAKSARVAPETLSVCYCHTPMRYIWDRFDDYFGTKPWPLRLAIGGVARRLRAWDRQSADRVQHWIANSTVVQRRIGDFYGVDSSCVEIIPPPVDTKIFRPEAAPQAPPGLTSGQYDLVVSALVPYKRIDLAVRAAVACGRHLVVVGGGPEGHRLRRLVADSGGTGKVSFVTGLSTNQLPAFYAHARCFVFPGLEDFGITPLESTACGRPVVAYQAGGALDTVIEGLNGIYFSEQRVAALAEALNDPRLDQNWDTAAMVAHAESFSRENFRQRMTVSLERSLTRRRNGD